MVQQQPQHLKRSDTPPSMLSRLPTSCVSEEVNHCAFDFDYDDEEFFVIDEEGDDDYNDIDNDGAYWRIPGNPEANNCQPGDFDWDTYDYETLTTRFSRQTTSTLDSILEATTSSTLSPSANFIIEDLHLLEEKNKTDNNAIHNRTTLTLAKFDDQRSPTEAQLIQLPKKCSPRLFEAILHANYDESPTLHQNSMSQSSATSSVPTAFTDQEDSTPKRSGATAASKRARNPRWSNLSPTFFSNFSKTPSPRIQSSPLPPIAETKSTYNSKYIHEINDDHKSKSTHPSTSTATAMESLTSEEVRDNEDNWSRERGLELTLSETIFETELEDEQSDIIRLDSIFSCPSSFWSDSDLVFENQTKNKRKRMWKRFRSKVAGWKRIASFHLFPHRRKYYTRFEI